ncbi:hypothetical protein CON36_33015 [Bacillus cereus]|uniref:SprT-like domain-containing protein n=1 Tax=Bacillus cereus TaxID=1396 RepID=A0A9X6STD0_BACCE|nr:hypothetical protein [Bacillus cereus]PDZ94591.1 hypothetical protein CON36_33015 [Bacillus cereus]
MSLSYEVHKILKTIVEKTYPNEKILSFFVEVHAKEMRSRHGDYNRRERKIRIFNLSQPTEYTVGTALHEVAHHVEYSLYGDTGHSKRFYQVFKELLETAVQMGVVDYQKLRTQQNASDIRALEKHFGPVTSTYNPEIDDKRNMYVIEVMNSYSIKDILKSRGYKFQAQKQCWSMEVEEQDIEQEKNLILQHLSPENLNIRKANDINIEAIYYVIVHNSYSCKDQLKQNGYYFNGYNQKGNVWVKKIKSTELRQEEKFLKQFKDIKVTIKGS